jgi:hypothetical protein
MMTFYSALPTLRQMKYVCNLVSLCVLHCPFSAYKYVNVFAIILFNIIIIVAIIHALNDEIFTFLLIIKCI